MKIAGLYLYPMKLNPFLIVFLFAFSVLEAQSDKIGVVTGNVVNDQKKPLESATVFLINIGDSTAHFSTRTDKDGNFMLSNISFGYYRLAVSYVGFSTLTIDSIYIRQDRYTFNLNDLTIAQSSSGSMSEVVIYAEKPLIQSKDGNLTFNAAESPLAAGSNASDLLTNVPLITKDPSGKILVRGKEPKILIDDKPVELNLQQLQDLLESMPGSAIEKIEVLTNPPPQYANEQGGVINIVTRKGRVGKSGRVSLFAGTRGEQGANGSFYYRKQGLNISVNAGVSNNIFNGDGYSSRENIFVDSVNHFNTKNNYSNKSIRPNLRASVDYDINKNHTINFVFQYNQNRSNNSSYTDYSSLNRFDELYRFSKRHLLNKWENYSPNISLNYTFKSKKAGETLRLFTNINLSTTDNDRNIAQQFFTPALVFINDSTQLQDRAENNTGYNFRLAYDLPFKDQKTFLSLGTYYNNANSRVVIDAFYKPAGGSLINFDALSNNFYFHQYITNGRASLKHIFSQGFSTSSGLSAENTKVQFELFKTDSVTNNSYWSFLPFFNLNKNWEEKLNLTASYRRSIRRPGSFEQNPSIDNSDPYNIRFGNPDLEASMVHNFDLVLGKSKKNFYANVGVGYNLVENIFSQIRIPVSDTRTEISWQNISDKKEYEMSTWSGYTLWNKLRMNLSASYTYNQYIMNEKSDPNNRFQNGSSFSSNFNTNYTWRELYSFSGNLNYNQFANPQGSVRSNVSLNFGAQAKMFQKKITVSLNLIDPFNQQENRTFTYGTNFKQENYSLSQTRNMRLSIGYNFIKAAPKKNAKQQLSDVLKTQG